jgi:hypothetical protein
MVIVVGVLTVLGLMAGVATAWVKAGSGFIDLWAKVEKFFDDRKHLRRPKKKFELDDEITFDSDDARSLVFDVGMTLGFTHHSCDVLIGIVGNPISALKYLVAVGKEGRKMASLQKEGKLQLPAPPKDQIELRVSATTRKRIKGTYKVERVQPRKKPANKSEDN